MEPPQELDFGAGDEKAPVRVSARDLLTQMRATTMLDRAPKDAVVVYTDGACSGNPGPGGWAWAVAPLGEPSGAGAENPSTNQRMEVKAVIEALRTLHVIDGVLEVRSDSTYVVNCFRDKWWQGWLAKGWLNSQRKAVANQDLWEDLFTEVVKRGANKTVFTWVKGHSGEPMNDLVDALAVEAAAT